MNIRQIMSLLKGWRWIPVDYDAAVNIRAGQLHTTEEVKDHVGWLWSLAMLVDQPRAELVMTYDLQETDASPFGLMILGLTSPNPWGMWCSVYDVAWGLYSIIWAPPDPLSFNKHSMLQIRAPANAATTLINYLHVAIVVDDEPLFRQSIKDLYDIPAMRGSLSRLEDLLDRKPQPLREILPPIRTR